MSNKSSPTFVVILVSRSNTHAEVMIDIAVLPRSFKGVQDHVLRYRESIKKSICKVVDRFPT